MNGVWLLPTKGRVANLRRFLSAAREMGTGTPGWILVNEDEWEKQKSEYEPLLRLAPENWTFKPVKAATYGEALRAIWPEVKGFKWIGLVCDDLVPASSNWDKSLVGATTGWNVVSSNDGWQAPARMHGAIVWSGDLARAVGWIFPDGLDHIFHDDIWETLGRETGCWQCRMEVMVKHLHEALEGVRGPTMDPSSDLWKHDQARFETWRDGGERLANLEAIQALMERKGVRAMKPDFTGVKLMIATPSHDGRYESHFMTSLYTTFDALRAQNVVCQFAEEKYTADIALARAKLFSTFVRSDCTHLLMVDADMGWDVSAVYRLFCAKKDFVAIAGPKKRYPLQFAANHTDVNGNPIQLQFDQETGSMEVSEIGCAFVLLSKACVTKLIEGYPELQFIGVTGDPEWGMFIPLIAHGRWFSEDFAFCKRWRNLGGRVFMVPDVKLKHTGFHTFEGAFSELIVPEEAKEAAE